MIKTGIYDWFGYRMALHLHDNDGTDDQHRNPGEGTINWDPIVGNVSGLWLISDLNVEAAYDCLLEHLDRLYNFTKKGNCDFLSL